MQHARLITERSLRELLRAAIEARAEGLVVLRDRDGLRHGVWVEGGYVLGVHVAGRHDPLLELLRQSGALDAARHRLAVAALYEGTARCGVLATERLGVPAVVVREALKRQLIERFVALLELSESAGHDAQLEPGEVASSERCLRMPLGSLLRHAEASARAACRPQPENSGEQARRALRSLARALHPDRHQHLDAEARARMSAELASATAAYHGFSRGQARH